jgi:Fe-S-cluster containining protein
MFAKARAEPEEEARMANLGLSLSEENGKHYFDHPCRFSVAGCCTIYDERFTKCRTFRCKLLRGYQAGQISLKEAQEKVREAMRLRSEVEAEEPSAVLITERLRLRSQLCTSNQRPQLLLKMMALDYYLDRHFRNKNPQIAPSDGVAERN